ncbi:MAG: hypothetical protein ACK55I_31855, partial [bacterium]
MNNNAFFRILLLLALAISTAGSQAQNNSLAFDGIDDAVTVSGASNLITTGTGLTLTTWVYPTNAA